MQIANVGGASSRQNEAICMPGQVPKLHSHFSSHPPSMPQPHMPLKTHTLFAIVSLIYFLFFRQEPLGDMSLENIKIPETLSRKTWP